MKKLTIVLTKRYGLTSCETVDIEIDGGSEAERARALSIAKVAVVNGWMSEIEEAEEEDEEEGQ